MTRLHWVRNDIKQRGNRRRRSFNVGKYRKPNPFENHPQNRLEKGVRYSKMAIKCR